MCGIFGIIANENRTAADAGLMRRLADALVHRGPDGEGFYSDRNVALGMRRLSIIDLEGGWQPLYNETGDICVICNGEIYNYIELRADLEARGHRLRTASDCEVISHLYEEHGIDFVHSLRGMFALALWDKRNRTLFIVRDRMGEKPLYVSEQGSGRLVFASELKALVGSGAVPFELDEDAVKLYYHYSFVPEPHTAVRGVRKLPAGHMLVVRLDPFRVEQRRYWSMEDAEPISGDPVEALRSVLDDVGELIIRSDVPVGVALSGGIDSSAIACLAARKYAKGQIQAFTVGYPGVPLQDERAVAKELTDHLGIPLHTMELPAEEVVDGFHDVCFRRDDPITDIAGSSYLAVMRLARSKGVPVMLMGQGGDELFWGYPWLAPCVTASERKRALLEGRAGLSSYLSLRKPPRSYSRGVQWLREGGGLLEGLRWYGEDRSSSPQRLAFTDRAGGRYFPTAAKFLPAAATPGFMQRTSALDPAALFTGPALWDRIDISATRLICDTYLRCNGIAEADRLSMAASVEVRLPLVDYRLVETVIGLRKAQPDHGLPAKHWLTSAVKPLVPQFVFARRKRGFSPPWRQWVKVLADRYGPELGDGFLVEQGVLRPEAARGLSRLVSAAGTPEPLALQSLVLEQWCRGMAAAASNARVMPAAPAAAAPWSGEGRDMPAGAVEAHHLDAAH